MLINVDISGITVPSLVNEPLKIVVFFPQNVTALSVRVCKWKWGLSECQATAGGFGTKHNRIFLAVLFSNVVCVSRGGKVLHCSLVFDKHIWNRSYIRSEEMKSNEMTSLLLPLTIQRCCLKNSLRFRLLLLLLLANANFHRRLGWNPLLPPPYLPPNSATLH